MRPQLPHLLLLNYLLENPKRRPEYQKLTSQKPMRANPLFSERGPVPLRKIRGATRVDHKSRKFRDQIPLQETDFLMSLISTGTALHLIAIRAQVRGQTPRHRHQNPRPPLIVPVGAAGAEEEAAAAVAAAAAAVTILMTCWARAPPPQH